MTTSILQPGFRLGKYEVLAHVATGGMGAVYKARDLALRRIVALKVLPTDLAAKESVIERFRREARHAARLNHANVVMLYEYGHDAQHDLHYLALEFVDGIDLGAYLTRKGQLPPEEVRRILIQAVRALDHIFSQGVVHRDIKPSNFLLARTGNKVVVKLIDLGLAHVVDDDEFKVTRDGTTVGTIDYLSPEQARDSRDVDVRSDIYSLGCTANHLLAGKAPFAEGGLGQRVLKHLEAPPPDVRLFSPSVSSEFWCVLEQMLAKKPEDRYATPAELLSDLKRIPVETTADDSEPEEPSEPEVESVPRPMPRRTEVPTPPPLDVISLGAVPYEQAKAALTMYERAAEVLAHGGGEEYARELLHNCLRLDPFVAEYRRALRELNRKASAGTISRWLGSLNVLAIKSKMRAARTAGDWRRVLDQGEEVLARHAADADTHIDMAEAADELGQPELALWLLEQGRELLPHNTALMAALARLFEKRGEWKPAIALWERVLRNEPDNYDARRMVDDLSVRAHIARAHYQR